MKLRSNGGDNITVTGAEKVCSGYELTSMGAGWECRAEQRNESTMTMREVRIVDTGIRLCGSRTYRDIEISKDAAQL